MDKTPMKPTCAIPEAPDVEESIWTVWAAANTYILVFLNDAIVHTQNVNGSPKKERKAAGEQTEWREIELGWFYL